jgi:protein TonB
MRSLALGAVALLANAALFFLVSRTNLSAKSRPAREAWVVREIFQPAPPPRSAPPADEVAQSVPDRPASSQELAPPTSFEAPTSENFAPRSLDLGATGLGTGPAVPIPQGVTSRFDALPGRVGALAATAPPPTELTLEQVDRPPAPAHTPLPPYPQWARLRKLTGLVTLKFLIDPEGGVRDIKIEGVEGDERFGLEAVQAVSGWRYEPASHQGKKVGVRVLQRIRFRLVE